MKDSRVAYRISQFISLLIGARIFMLLLLSFALYVSTFFIINQEETLRQFVFDYKIHGIVFCSILSIAAGGLINQFYDLEKDRIEKPFVTRIQSFLKQKYFLYTYILLTALALVISYLLSPRIFVFFVFYQFMMWFYSHKLSKMVILNNLVFVSLTLYPFFGMLVYYQHFSLDLFLMALFLFLILLCVDILKDVLTIRTDALFGYKTIPTEFGMRTSAILLSVLFILASFAALWTAIRHQDAVFLMVYFCLSAIVLLLGLWPLRRFRFKEILVLLNSLRLWIFLGVLFMLLGGVYEKLN